MFFFSRLYYSSSFQQTVIVNKLFESEFFLSYLYLLMRSNLWQSMVFSGYYKSSSIALPWVNGCRDNCYAMSWESVQFCLYVSFSYGAFDCFLFRFASVSHLMSRCEFWKQSGGFSLEVMTKWYSNFFMTGNALVMKRYKKYCEFLCRKVSTLINTNKIKKIHLLHWVNNLTEICTAYLLRTRFMVCVETYSL